MPSTSHIAELRITRYNERPVITRELNGFVVDESENEEGTTYTLFVPHPEPYKVTSVPMTQKEIEKLNKSMFPEPKNSKKVYRQSVSSYGGGSWKTTAWVVGEKPWWDERNSWENSN